MWLTRLASILVTWLVTELPALNGYAVLMGMTVFCNPVNAFSAGTIQCPRYFHHHLITLALLYDGPVEGMADLTPDYDAHWVLHHSMSVSDGYFLGCEYGKAKTSLRVPVAYTRCDEDKLNQLICR